MSASRHVILFALLFNCGSAQLLSPGSCPPVATISHFDFSQYVGTWFVNRESFEILEVGSRCGQESYAVINRNNTYEATYNATKIITGEPFIVKHILRSNPMDPTSGKLGDTFPVPLVPENLPYWILGTDFTSYSVVWGCSNLINIANIKVLWLMTRDRIPTNSIAVDTALAVIKSNGLNNIPLRLMDQSNCF